MKDITLETFENDVLQASMQIPVLVDFWATWCGPCRTLGPILEKLEADYKGRFTLAKVDSDRERELSQAFGVRSIPTVILMKGGQPVDGFVGALPEGQIRTFLDKHVPAESELASEGEQDEAGALLAEGDVGGALEKLSEALAVDPSNDAARFDYVRLLADDGRLADARRALEPVADRITGHTTDQRFVALDHYVRAHEAALRLPPDAALETAIANDRRDFASAFGLAQRRWAAGDPAGAMDSLLEIVKRDRNWEEGLARRTYVAILELLTARAKQAQSAQAEAPAAGKLITSTAAPQSAPQDPLVAEYRRKLSMSLF
jgi:putative thioredoxin